MLAQRLLQHIRAASLTSPSGTPSARTYHWDHTGGNYVFKDAGATVLSSVRTRGIQVRTPRQRASPCRAALPMADPYLADDTIAQAGRSIWAINGCVCGTWAEPKRTMRWPSICPRRAASWRVTR